MKMAYRRGQGVTRVSTFKEKARDEEGEGGDMKRSSSFSNLSSSSPRATRAVRASLPQSRDRDPDATRYNLDQETLVVEDGLEQSESKSRFWGILARKATAILDDDSVPGQIESPVSAPARIAAPMLDSPTTTSTKTHHRNRSHGLEETTRLSKGLRPISNLSDKALKEGSTHVGNKATDILHEPKNCTPVGNKDEDIPHEREVRTPVGIKASDVLVGRKLQIRKKGTGLDGKGLTLTANGAHQVGGMLSPQIQNDHENQLKAARDVAMATAAKAKLLLRELKTVKADLAFAKARCAQLEQENKVLRCREKGDNRQKLPADDDLILLQLETLLAEKARLANENSTYARENRFLREVVEYHQLTMQGFVQLDEDDDDYDAEVSIHQVSKMLSVTEGNNSDHEDVDATFPITPSSV